MTTTLTAPVASVPSDADLLVTTAALLAALPTQTVPHLSQLLEFVCAACAGDGADRAERLELELAEYLHDWRVIRAAEVSPAGLDAWAAGAPRTFLRAAIVGCARCQLAGGDR